MEDTSDLLHRVDSLLKPRQQAASENLTQRLEQIFGHEEFRPPQREVIESVLNGENVLVTLPTGYGKSVCYQLPGLMRDGLTVVVSPLIALMKDQVDALKARGIDQAAFVNSTLSPEQQRYELCRVGRGEVRLLYCSPERFRSRRFTATIANAHPWLFVVDEVHCISQWGHDFRPDYLALGDVRGELRYEQVALFTATATAEVRRDILRQLGLERVREFTTQPTRENLRLSVVHCLSEEEKFAAVANLAEAVAGNGIIYVGRRQEAEQLATFLNGLGHRVDFYHAGRTKAERARVQEQFFDDRADSLRIVIATCAFGLGIDKADVRFVAHWTTPGSLEEYWQEAGRAGRDGAPAWCVLLHLPDDRSLQEWFIKESVPTKRDLVRLLRWTERSPAVSVFRFVDLKELDWRRGLDEGRMRVGLAHLERLGFLTRLPDVPSMLTVQFSPQRELAISPPATWLSDLASKPRMDVVRFCQTHALSPAELMSALLDAELEGLLSLDGTGNLAVVQVVRDSELLEAMDEAQLGFEELRQAKIRRLDWIVRYAISEGCRGKLLSDYFGGEAPPAFHCGVCDNCGPENGLALSGQMVDEEVRELLKKVTSPTFSGRHFALGASLAFHTEIHLGERRHTPLGDMVYRFKYGAERGLAENLAALLVKFLREDELGQQMAQAKLVAAVPSTIKERAYDPVSLLAGELAAACGLSTEPGLLVKRRRTLPQKEMKTAVQKRRNVAGAFAVAWPEAVRGKSILLLDDLCDSKMTLDECARTLLDAGAANVAALTLTRTSHS